jgi:hypothetical protein
MRPEPSAKNMNNGHDTRIVATVTFSKAKLEAATREVSKSCKLRADSPAQLIFEHRKLMKTHRFTVDVSYMKYIEISYSYNG